MALRMQLLLAAVAFVLLPGAIYAGIVLGSSRVALADAGGRFLTQEARGAADRLAAELRADLARLEALAVQDVMREIRIGDLDKRIAALLGSAQRACEACLALHVLDASARVVASSDPAWIGRALPGTEPVNPVEILGPFQPEGGGPRQLQLRLRIPDPDAPQESLGQVVALLDWQRVLAVIRRVRENLSSAGLETDVLIAGPDGRLIGSALRADTRWREAEQLALPPAGSDSPAGYVDSTAELLVGRSSLPAGLPPWSVLVVEPLSEAYAPARRATLLLLAILAAVLTLALALAVAAARRVTRPLAELASAAAAVGRGERPVAAVPVRSRNEVGTLTEAFNRMAADLARVEHRLIEAAKFSFVGELAAGVAHEVRTPLGVLRSSAQLLARSPELKNPESLELLHLVQAEVDRIDRVVSALLDLGRPRELRAEPTSIGPVLLRAARLVEAQAREKHITIGHGRFEPDPPLHGDPELLYQVVLNLLVNAIQVLPEGGAVNLELLPEQEGCGGFEVRDNGPGMNAEVQARLFEPFFTRRPGGTGLGLTFVQQVVHEHGGRVQVDSAPGRGAAFRVRIPLAPAAV